MNRTPLYYILRWLGYHWEWGLVIAAFLLAAPRLFNL